MFRKLNNKSFRQTRGLAFGTLAAGWIISMLGLAMFTKGESHFAEFIGAALISDLGGQNVSDRVSGSSEGLGLIARMKKTNYAAGERIELQVAMTNGSARPFSFMTYYPAAEYKYQVIGLTDKQEAPLTRCGTNVLLKPQQIYHTSTIEIQPGMTHTDFTILNQLFDLTIPQEYEVTVSRQVPRAGANSVQRLRSNPIRFSVSAL
jgi:hypothetical protein